MDTNVLVYAHRPDLPNHAAALQWLKHLAEGARPWGLPVFCLGEFIRVTTHQRILAPPSGLDKALSALEGLLSSPSIRILGPGPLYPRLFAQAVRDADARGNLSFDAQIAAVCLEHGASDLLTLDRDFSRFAGLKLISVDTPPAGHGL